MKKIVCLLALTTLPLAAQAEILINPSLNFASRLIYEQMPESSIDLRTGFGDQRTTTEKMYEGITCSATILKTAIPYDTDAYECDLPQVTLGYDMITVQGKAAELLIGGLTKILATDKEKYSATAQDSLLGTVKVDDQGNGITARFSNRSLSGIDADISCHNWAATPAVGELFDSPGMKARKGPHCDIRIGRMTIDELVQAWQRNKAGK